MLGENTSAFPQANKENSPLATYRWLAGLLKEGENEKKKRRQQEDRRKLNKTGKPKKAKRPGEKGEKKNRAVQGLKSNKPLDADPNFGTSNHTKAMSAIFALDHWQDSRQEMPPSSMYVSRRATIKKLAEKAGFFVGQNDSRNKESEDR